jgi:membrane protein DedA with SNARE-associated domain
VRSADLRGLEWAEKQLGERGAYLILIARFVPGGRTATTFSAGMVRFQAVVFFPIAAVAGVAWAGYAVLLGYYGGACSRSSRFSHLASRSESRSA